MGREKKQLTFINTIFPKKKCEFIMTGNLKSELPNETKKLPITKHCRV